VPATQSTPAVTLAGSGRSLDPLSVEGALLAPPEEVLSTLNRDGSRRWLRPRLSHGGYLTARRWVAYALIALFTLIPHIRVFGKPLMLLDVAHRQFTFIGVTFLPTDTVLLALFMLAFFVGIFLFTAVLGRVWCGWACPQTVYLEFLYRPLERLIEGTAGRGGASGRRRTFPRMLLLYVTYLVISLFLAHTFLAYFVDVGELARWMARSPFEHPGSFGVMAVTTGLMMFNFCYFREQTCLLACPYGRLQSVLLDRDSLIISYDEARGEPRGKFRVQRSELSASGDGEAATGCPELAPHSLLAPQRRGDCVDCNLCVITCPTGIDIRKGLQMECVACAQCIDACDAVMDKIDRPRGLIRYTSQARLEGNGKRLLRPRVIVYSAVLLVALTALSVLVMCWPSASVQVLRSAGLPYHATAEGYVANPLRLKVTNRSDAAQDYEVTMADPPDAEIRLETRPLRVQPGKTVTVEAVVLRPAESVTAASMECHIRVRDGGTYEARVRYILLGPPVLPGAGHAAP